MKNLIRQLMANAILPVSKDSPLGADVGGTVLIFRYHAPSQCKTSAGTSNQAIGKGARSAAGMKITPAVPEIVARTQHSRDVGMTHNPIVVIGDPRMIGGELTPC
jgi:hypothetical protein